MSVEDHRLMTEAMYSKCRSASICAFGFPPGSTEHLMACAAAASTPPPHRHVSGAAAVAAAEDAKRRRPAARSQSARTSGGRSIRKKALVAAAAGAYHDQHLSDSRTSVRSGYSDPRLHESSAQDGAAFKRKPSSRKVAANHRKSGAFLDVPPPSGDNKKLAEPEDPENSYRLRSFSFTSKGIINRGDSFRKRRSRSNSLAREEDSGKECTPPTAGSNNSNNNQLQHQQYQDRRRNDHGDDGDDYCDDISSHTVSLMGARGVGKTTLISQFMTSEYINAYERQKDNYESSVQSVCIMLNGEESELRFINERELSIKEDRLPKSADAFLVLFSVVDKNSFETAETILKKLQEHEMLRSRPAILVGNKVDMARSREVSAQEGRYLACTYRAKYIEVSVGINHNVDELLVGILTQIRLKRASGDEGHDHWYKNRNFIKASLKARQMLTWVFGKEDTKMKNCENLHVL